MLIPAHHPIMIDQNNTENIIDDQQENRLDLTPQSSDQNIDQTNDTPSEYYLKNSTVYRLVEHSVSGIALECGYQKAHQFCLDVLTDVCYDYINKIATSLRFCHEVEEWRDNGSDFSDNLERVFHQMNIPSAANLHQFICRMDAIKRYRSKQPQQMTSCHTTSEEPEKSAEQL